MTSATTDARYWLRTYQRLFQAYCDYWSKTHTKITGTFRKNRRAISLICESKLMGTEHFSDASPRSSFNRIILKEITPMQSTYHKLVRYYGNMAMTPIPLKFKSKQPAIENWTKFTIEDERDIERYFVEPFNVGVLTGKPSNNLIDVDIDHPGALKFAPYFLPETYCIFGRASKRRSHWVYRVPHPGNRLSLSADRMIVEVRGNGCCTLFPESIHPSGEKVEFVNPKDFIPDRSTWAKLTQGATQIAVATVLYPHWSEQSHCRHDLALALAAFLARREWKAEDVAKLVEAIAKEANDEESEDRLRCVDDTFAAYAQGRRISGDEELVQLLGVELVVHIEK